MSIANTCEKKDNDLVSVIIPLYNAEKFICDTVKSVLSQSYSSLEIIIVDDGSTDGSVSVVLSSFSDERIKLIKTENHGAPHARNVGIDNALGEYYYFFDADDIMEPYSIQHLLDSIKRESADLAIGSFVEINTNGKPIREDKVALESGVYQCQTSNLKDLMCNVCPFPGSKLYKAFLIKEHKLRFDDVRIAQDLNFYLKYLALCKKVIIVDENVSRYRLVAGSISHGVSRKTFDIIKSLDYVEHFYSTTNGVDSRLIAYLNDLRIMNYALQASKYVFIHDRCEAYSYFMEYYRLIERIAHSMECVSGKSLSAICDMRRRYKYRFVFFSSLYLIRCRHKAKKTQQ